MTIYYVELTTSIVDGSAYTSNDTIIIRAGARGNLLLRNFNGNGQYITVTNERTASNARVEIAGDNSVGWGTLSIENCKYIDLRGDNNPNLEHGIKITKMPNTTRGIWPYSTSDHIKISYIEIAFSGIHVGDSSLSSEWIFDTFEIHHNYIHGTDYAGMYLGMNLPDVLHNDNPYIANFSVHDNLMEDLGAYGITLKGVHPSSGDNFIYNNTIRGSSGGQSTGHVTERDAAFKFGIGGAYYYGDATCHIHNNWIEKTVGAGIHIGIPGQQVYNNIICGCGTCDDELYGNGIITRWHAKNAHIYDNIIIQPKRYGIYGGGTTVSALMSRNLIGDAGIGEWGQASSGKLTESTGADANIYHQNVADFGFNRWSDDGDYSNDDFTFGGLCDGVICENVCVGNDLWSQKCNPLTGLCVSDQLLESNSASCQDPCAGVVCDNICIGKDLYSQRCIAGDCFTYQLIESNSSTCVTDPCAGVVCPNICAGNDLWSQTCDTDTGACVLDKLLQQDAINCVIPDRIPTDDSTIQTYLVLGGIGLAGLAILLLGKNK